MSEKWGRVSHNTWGLQCLYWDPKNNNFFTFPRKFHDFGHIFMGVGGVTCRVKIDPLDLGKPYTKFIWGDSPLQMEFNEPILAVKVINFNISHVETWNVQVTKSSKWPYVSRPISRKRLKETKRHLQGFKYCSSWVQIEKQIKNRLTLRGDIPTSRYRTKWPKWPISGPVSLL